MNILGSMENLKMDKAKDESLYYHEIGEIMSKLHADIPVEIFDTTEVPVSTNIREEHFKGENYSRAVMYLLSNGCEWALKSANGCTMCGHLAQQTRRVEQISDEDLVSQFNKEFSQIDFSKYPLLNLYNNGSFFNDKEISPNAREKILQIIKSNKDIKMLVLETRPEFVSEAKVLEVKELLPNIHVEIAIGLELKNDYYRTVCINKGFTLKQFEEAAEIITKHLSLRTYVLLKPPFFTEKEAIEEAVKTIEYAFNLGSRIVSLEGCTVQDHTLIKYLYEQEMYNPPKLWSIIEVIKRVQAEGQLIIGMFQFFPSPDTVPHNCNLCNEDILEKMKQYNRILDKTIFDSISCKCKSDWKSLLEEPGLPFNDRVENFTELMRMEF